MVKKLKIISTVLVLCFVIAMIPIAILATRNMSPNVSSTLKYFVEDIEGQFFYKIIGNSQPQTNDVALSTLFYTEKIDEEIITKNANGEILPQNQAVQINNINIEFDTSHQKVSYYFVFANFGVNEIEGDDRSVNVKVSVNNWGNFDDFITATWSYNIMQIEQNSQITDLLVESIGTDPNTVSQGDSNFDLLSISGTKLDPFDKETQKFNYIVMKYELNLSSTSTSFNTRLNLIINMTSNQNN